MKITFIRHSGFAVEMEHCVLLFDVWEDPAKVVPPLLAGEKPVYVFASHLHGDHFNPAIFDWKDRVTEYILHKDCRVGGRAENVRLMDAGAAHETAHFSVHMYGSTDAGGSYMVRCEGKTIFHAGDLNWWHWAGESDGEKRRARDWYRQELAAIRETEADVVFFPVDARQAVAREWGVKAFLSQVSVKELLVPMHAFGIRWCPSYEFRWQYEGVPLWIPGREGDRIVK